MTFIVENFKEILKATIIISIVFLFISNSQISPLNPIVYKTKLWVEDTYVFGGIRISEEEGLSSYGNHSVGLLNDTKEGLTTQDVENNYYEYHLEINKNYLDKKLELSDNPDIQLGYYDRNTGFTVRTIPYLIHKTNIFSIKPSTYVENFYFLITSIFFGYMVLKILEKEGFFVAATFFSAHMMYWIFIIHTRSFATPYLICIIPFLIPFTRFAKYLYNKKYNFYFMSLILLVPFLEHITVGYLHIFSLLTGIYIKNNLSFLKEFIYNNFFKLGFALGLALLISQIIVILQNYFFLGQSFRYTLESHWYNLTKRADGEGVFYCYGEGSVLDVVDMYMGSKIINLKLFDLNYLNLTIVSFVVFLIIKFGFNNKLSRNNEVFYLYLVSLFFTITWFVITKSHALCHPHFQPMLFLYSTFPIITMYYGRIIQDVYSVYFKK